MNVLECIEMLAASYSAHDGPRLAIKDDRLYVVYLDDTCLHIMIDTMVNISDCTAARPLDGRPMLYGGGRNQVRDLVRTLTKNTKCFSYEGIVGVKFVFYTNARTIRLQPLLLYSIWRFSQLHPLL